MVPGTLWVFHKRLLALPRSGKPVETEDILTLWSNHFFNLCFHFYSDLPWFISDIHFPQLCCKDITRLYMWKYVKIFKSHKNVFYLFYHFNEADYFPHLSRMDCWYQSRYNVRDLWEKMKKNYFNARSCYFLLSILYGKTSGYHKHLTYSLTKLSKSQIKPACSGT